VLFPAGGGFAELALASADRLAPMPGKANFVEAAGLVIGAGTAYEGLVDRGRLQTGETVLITAAAGGVGSAAVQIAAAAGARVVAVASRRRSRITQGDPARVGEPSRKPMPAGRAWVSVERLVRAGAGLEIQVRIRPGTRC
jgi:threonine dehydrogenase-like Zn-dependent dehydrogenase